MDHPSDDTLAKALSSKAGVGRLEESGRAARDKGGQKRAKWALGKLAQGPKEGMEVLAKIQQDEKKGRDSHKSKVSDIRTFFAAKGRASDPPLDRKGETEKGSGPKNGDSAAEAGSGGGKY